MNVDDIVYIVCLLFCTAIGNYYRQRFIDADKQKFVGSLIGVAVLFAVSGYHIIHTFLSFGLCAIAITQCHPRNVHLAAFVIMFGYLVFFRTLHFFNLPSPPSHTNMVLMILTLKLAGVAFEKNTSYLKIKANKDLNKKIEGDVLDNTEQIIDYDMEIQNISVAELFYYSFNYIGVLTGPYYRYRTFRDYFETPFKNYANSMEATLHKLKECALYAICFLICNQFWPIEYAMNDEFYEECSWLYRIMYVWPSFFIFRMRIYTGLGLSEAVCLNAGFGAYPDDCNVVNGEGPKTYYLHMKRDAEKHKYNFKTIQNVDVQKTETCYTFREAMKHWNICVQYWLAVNVYKRFPSKKYRTGVTLLISAFWHGFMPGHYMCIMGAPFYVPVEDMFNTTIRKDTKGFKRNIIDIIFWINKFFAFSYLSMAFLLLTFDKIWKYYNSVYHFGYIWYLSLLVLGITLTKARRQSKSSKQ